MKSVANQSRSSRARHGVLVAAIIALALGAVAPATAQTSIGIILGEPSGLSGKQWIGDNASLDLAIAWSFLGGGSIYAHLDYQQHFDDLDIDEGDLLWFFGAGPKISIGQDVILGVRVPVGLVYHFSDVPLEVFLEVAPAVLLFPAFTIDAGGGIGIRYRL